MNSAHALGSVEDAHAYKGMGKADESQILGISLSGMKAEYHDILNLPNMPITPIVDLGSAGNCLVKVTDVRVIKDRRNRSMAFVPGIDVHGPKLDPDLVMFADAFEKCGRPTKNKVYLMTLSRLRNGSLQILSMDTVETIRERHAKSIVNSALSKT
jgi:hypothetical protein